MVSRAVQFRFTLVLTTLIFNTHYNEDDDKTPDKKKKQQEYGHCLIMLPKSKKFPSTRIVTANSEYLQHKCNTCKKGDVPIAYAPQESTGVQNASVIILHVPKTIFQHQAEFSCSKPKNGMPMTIYGLQPKNIECNNLKIIWKLFFHSIKHIKISVANDRKSISTIN